MTSLNKEQLYVKLTTIYQIIEGIPDAQIAFSRPSLIQGASNIPSLNMIADPLGWLAMSPTFMEVGFETYETDKGSWSLKHNDNLDGIIPFMHWIFESMPAFDNLMNFGLLFDGRFNSWYDSILDPNGQLTDKQLFLKRITRFVLSRNLR